MADSDLKQCLSIMLRLPFRSRLLRISISEASGVVCDTERSLTPLKVTLRNRCNTEEAVLESLSSLP